MVWEVYNVRERVEVESGGGSFRRIKAAQHRVNM